MRKTAFYVGIDLGTTNSAAAVFDGERVSHVRTGQGGLLTPSVVHISAKGKVVVGDKARHFLASDPQNTRAEFKRLMGTKELLTFESAGVRRRPEELSAEVLKALKGDVEDQLGHGVERAVISVPALFELPQNAATSEAARLAGFSQVELLQEPIASALAAGWSSKEGSGAWLVYDFGGGTLDVSLLETRDGLLRVVGHDGDNFLGGRDFDSAIVDFVLAELLRDKGWKIQRSDPANALLVRRLRVLAEEAKIELTRANEAIISLAPPDVPEASETLLRRADLDRLVLPGIDRSLEVCTRLLKAHGVEISSLAQVVLVGGPTMMPILRRRVREVLEAPFGEGLDPMTLVAQGAAIYAATAGLEAKKSAPAEVPGRRVWLQYPAMSSDLTPYVAGRFVEPATPPVVEVKVARQDGGYTSPSVKIDAEGAFILAVELEARQINTFSIEAKAADQTIIPTSPASFAIMQGLTIGDPPLSRSIGVALADNGVETYFQRGCPLPARRTFEHHTVESVAKGSEDCVLKIPIVQGEFDLAHLCRLVGTLQIRGQALSANVPAGSRVEVTLELDRGGRLFARAFLPSVSAVFEQVAELLVPEASPEVLASTIQALRARVSQLRSNASRVGKSQLLAQLAPIMKNLESIERDLIAAKGGELDEAHKVRRGLIELDAQLEAIEVMGRWPELETTAKEQLAFAARWVGQYGTAPEQNLLLELQDGIQEARAARDPLDLLRHVRLIGELGSTSFFRHPEAWEWMFRDAAADAEKATDMPRANELVRRGRMALEKGDRDELRNVVRALWKLMPASAKNRRLSFDSGVS